MNLLILKLILTPLLIAVATLAVRRWGFMPGGLFTGLPLISGPISLFLALEQGPHFAERSSHGMLLGAIALAAFCVAYVRTAKGLRWLTPLIVGFVSYCFAAWSLSFFSFNLGVLTLLVLFFLLAALKVAGLPVSSASRVAAPSWDIPMRMVTATAMVLFITGWAEHIGPKWSGILASFPVFTCIMGVFAHKQNGAAAAHGLIRGIIIGCFGAVSFYLVVGLAVERTSVAVTYLLATAAALVVNGLCLGALTQKTRNSKSGRVAL
jgi:drug/metabolite transporter (DMT)-like permease